MSVPAPAVRSEAARKLTAWLLPLLLLTALALRVWFASGGLDYKRFFDERYSLDNVAALLDGKAEPVWGWYPSLSYLPQTAVLWGVERLYEWSGRDWLRVRKKDRFTATGIAICRVLGCLYGVAAIWCLYRIGRRIFDPATGLVAAFLFASLPEQVRLSAYIKPDTLMVLTVLIAFWLTLAAFERPSWRAFLTAGAAIGLVGASKPYGVAGAAPLAAVAAVHARREPTVLLKLLAAAATSAAVFLLLNPHLGVLLDFAERNRAIYEGRGAGFGSVVAATVRAPFAAHGVFVGTVAVVGLAMLVWRAASRSRARRERVEAALVLVFAGSYLGMVWLLFRWAKTNIWLPLMPFTALAAALVLVGAGRWARRSLPRPAGAVAAAALLVGVIGWQQWRVFEWTYLVRVPTTWAAAAEFLSFRIQPPLTGRLIWAELSGDERMPAARQWNRGHATPIPVGDLAGLGPRRLDRADAEVFPKARLATSPFHRARRDRFPGSEELVVEPAPFLRRGTALQIVLHPWTALRPVRAIELRPAAAGGGWVGVQPGDPATRANRYASFELEVAHGAGRPGLRLGRRELDLFWVRNTTDGKLWVSDRFRTTQRARPVTLELAGGGDPPRLLSRGWEFRVPGP